MLARYAALVQADATNTISFDQCHRPSELRRPQCDYVSTWTRSKHQAVDRIALVARYQSGTELVGFFDEAAQSEREFQALLAIDDAMVESHRHRHDR
ncbi:MAG TPA: hypothetical protein VNG70_01160, partial [Candidatus Limnocylindria bacterium]|nr:hypothetical protein [Candidatus Limnocylindria bacterium]